MPKKINILTLSLILLILFSYHPTAQAQGTTDQDNKEKLWGSYLVSGTLGTNYMIENVTGDDSLFRSQFNLKEGLNIGNTFFRAYKDPEKNAFLDRIALDISGFGSEPYGRAALSLEKKNKFTLSGGYTERKYFSDVASFANPLFDAESEESLFRSFHTWNTTEKSYDIQGRLNVFSWMKLNALWQRNNLGGDSLVTLRLMNNEFPLNEPVNQTSDVFRLGGDFNIKDLLFYSLSGTYQKFGLDQTTSTDSNNLGIRGLPAGLSSTYLTEQSRHTEVELETWSHDHSLQIYPVSWMNLDGRFTSSRSEGTSSGEESLAGQFVLPLYDFISSAALLNQGNIKKDLDKANLTAHFNITPKLRLNTGYDHYNSSIDNTGSASSSYTRSYNNKVITEAMNTGQFIGIKQNKLFLDASYAISSAFTAGAGYSQRQYTLRLGNNSSEKTSFKYKLSAFFGTLQYRLSKMFSLKATLGKGGYDNVLARLIPQDSVSAKLEGRFTLNNNLSGSLYYKHQKLENSDFSYSSTYDGYGGNLNVKLLDENLGLILHFSKNDLSSAMDIVRFVSLFTQIEDISEYESDVTLISGGLWYKKGRLDLSAGHNQTEVKGTFPVRIRLPYVRASVKLFAGFAVTLNYRYFYHMQNLFQSQNYKAHILNFGFLYDF